MSRLMVAAALVIAAGCGEEIDPAGLPSSVSIDDYEQWPSIEVSGEIPGHGDTIRLIYANDAARMAEVGQYREGSVLVKEIYARGEGGARGALDYRAVMRRMVSNPPDGVGELDVPAEDDGWLYTYLDDDVETYLPSCWSTCHRQAPFEGAWFDYSQIP